MSCWGRRGGLETHKKFWWSSFSHRITHKTTFLARIIQSKRKATLFNGETHAERHHSSNNISCTRRGAGVCIEHLDCCCRVRYCCKTHILRHFDGYGFFTRSWACVKCVTRSQTQSRCKRPAAQVSRYAAPTRQTAKAATSRPTQASISRT